MGSPLRALARAVAYVAWTLLMLPAQVVAVALGLGAARRIPIFYHRNCLRLMGIKLDVVGEMSRAHPTLFVSNHGSYIDITVLGSIIPGSFVAKSEIANWPFFGLLAKLQRSVFVDRRGPNAGQHRDDLVARLNAGDWLILFPEGTSSDGNRVLPFKTALFAVAGLEVGGKPLTVQPVSIAYTRLDDMPVGRTFRPFFAWYGETALLSHAWDLIGLGTLTVSVQFHPPVTLADFGSRKALARHCFDTVATGLATANAGRPPAPALPKPPPADPAVPATPATVA